MKKVFIFEIVKQKANHGLVDNYVNHSQAMRNGFLDENTAIQPMTSMQGSVESEYSGEFPHRADHATGSVNAVVPLSIPLQPCPYPPGKGLQLIENLSSHPEPSTAKGFTIVTEDRTFDRGSISVSDVYSQGYVMRLYSMNVFFSIDKISCLSFLHYSACHVCHSTKIWIELR